MYINVANCFCNCDLNREEEALQEFLADVSKVEVSADEGDAADEVIDALVVVAVTGFHMLLNYDNAVNFRRTPTRRIGKSSSKWHIRVD